MDARDVDVDVADVEDATGEEDDSGDDDEVDDDDDDDDDRDDKAVAACCTQISSLSACRTLVCALESSAQISLEDTCRPPRPLQLRDRRRLLLCTRLCDVDVEVDVDVR